MFDQLKARTRHRDRCAQVLAGAADRHPRV